MARIQHPDDASRRIEVEPIDHEEYRGTVLLQVQARDDSITLSDESGDAPWMEAEEVLGA